MNPTRKVDLDHNLALWIKEKEKIRGEYFTAHPIIYMEMDKTGSNWRETLQVYLAEINKKFPNLELSFQELLEWKKIQERDLVRKG